MLILFFWKLDIVSRASLAYKSSAAQCENNSDDFSNIEGLENEPEGPIVKTSAIPGPKSLEMSSDLDKIQVF